MFRQDIVFLLPALGIASYQVFFLWNNKKDEAKDSLIEGKYNEYDKFRIDYFIFLACVIFFLQLLYPILPITNNSGLNGLLIFVGYALIFFGVITATTGLKQLDQNWSGMQDYKIKKGHQLIQTGIYKFIRHPIYAGAILEIIGFELIANSWLVAPLSLISIVVTNNHIIYEEKLLVSYFGEQYKKYQKKTKKFIPYIL